MEYSLEHVSGPSVEPVTLAAIKQTLNLDPNSTTEDADLAAMITAARIEAEKFLGKKIGRQSWDVVYDYWPYWDDIRVPVEPLISVDAITFTDIDGNVSAYSPDYWAYSASRGAVWLKDGYTWLVDDLQPLGGLRFRVTVGIEPKSDGGSPPTLRWPENIRRAIMFRVGTFYNFREDMVAGTTMQAAKVGTFEALLSGDKEFRP